MMFQTVCRLSGLGLALLLVVFLFSSPAFATGTISVVGEVNYDFQLVTDDDQIFEIMTDEKGEELIGHSGERVTVTGEIIMEGEDRTIKVLSFEILEDEEQDSEASEKE